MSMANPFLAFHPLEMFHVILFQLACSEIMANGRDPVEMVQGYMAELARSSIRDVCTFIWLRLSQTTDRLPLLEDLQSDASYFVVSVEVQYQVTLSMQSEYGLDQEERVDINSTLQEVVRETQRARDIIKERAEENGNKENTPPQ